MRELQEQQDTLYSLEHDFEELWKSYPSKTGSKEKAIEAWRGFRAIGDTKEVILAGIQRYLEYVKQRRNNGFPDLKYQHGDTFFVGRGWTTEWSLQEHSKKPLTLDEIRMMRAKGQIR